MPLFVRRQAMIAGVLGLAAFLLFFRLGDRPLRNPDEGRYAKISQEMLQTGDWVRPTLYGIEYLRKPPLYYWLIACAMGIFGQNEFAARSVGATAALLTVLLIYLFARKAFGEAAAVAGALILATNFWFIHVGRYLVIDMVFTFWVVSAVLFFYRWHCQPKSTARLVIFYLCLAMAFLTKGILGPVLPAAGIFGFAVYTRQGAAFWKRLRPTLGALLILAVAGPWLAAITSRESDFWNIFFVREHWQRATLSGFEHREPWFFYPLMLATFFFPLCLFLPIIGASLKNNLKDAVSKGAAALLTISSVSMIALLSFSKSKLATYLLPTIPFVSMLLGVGVVRWIDGAAQKSTNRRGARYFQSLMIFLIAVSVPMCFFRDAWVAPFGLFVPPELSPSLRWFGRWTLMGSLAGLILLIKQKKALFFVSQTVMTACLILEIQTAMSRLNADYSSKQFAEALTVRNQSSERIFIYGHPGAFYDFGFYLRRPVRLVGLEGEMEIVRPRPSHTANYLTREAFFNLATSGEPLFCLIRNSDYAELPAAVKKHAQIILQNSRKVLFEIPLAASTAPSK